MAFFLSFQMDRTEGNSGPRIYYNIIMRTVERDRDDDAYNNIIIIWSPSNLLDFLTAGILSYLPIITVEISK